MKPDCRALSRGLLLCHGCSLLVPGPERHGARCPRCHAPLHGRKPDSIARTWALLVTASLLYLPANVLPIMKTTWLGNTQADTIMSGVVFFLSHGDWPLALVIFVASVLVPLLKIFALFWLLVSVYRRSPVRRRERTVLFRVTEIVGRWSMVDVFVVALLVALVQAGNLIRIEPGLGAAAFAGVVVLTMLAARAFDPRLIWDHQEALDGC